MRMTTCRANAIVAGATMAVVVMITTAAIAARDETVTARAGGQAPPLLSETGLYRQGTLQIDAGNRPYSPQYPLWSDGAGKSRWVHLPKGSTIDITNPEAWEFPVGTKFWKEFAFNGRKVETRFLWKASRQGWVFATYAWNEDETDARRAPEDGIANAYAFAPGASHSLPSVGDCRACHDGARTEILGFNTLQLSDDRDPRAPHAEPLQPGMITLRTLLAEGLAQPYREELVVNPPRIPGDAVTRAALGYLSANCGHCHNREGSLASVGLFLKHSAAARTWQDEPAVQSTVDYPSTWQVPGAPEGTSRRVNPAVPDLSAVLRRIRSRNPSSQMPPLGTGVADREGIEALERWVNQLRSVRLADARANAPTR